MTRVIASIALLATSAFGNPACDEITSEDALFVVDFQNDFMAPVPVRSSPPNYDISGHVVNGSIQGGSLAVGGTDELIDPINKWISYFNERGGQVFASLDWHPSNHCSFCRNGTASSNPGGYHPDGAFCAPLPQPGFNATGRCVDSVAVADWNRGTLAQWPTHCVETSFGARFQPYLALPANATVVKKGWDVRNDTYSAFGGTQSAQTSPFDTEDSEKVLRGRRGLAELLESRGIRRFWAVGIALDYCVGGTVLDALGKNNDTKRPRPDKINTVVLVEPCTRAVDPSGTGAAMSAAIKAAGGKIATRLEPEEAIRQVCEGAL